jgi:hypothetical protein
MQIEIDALHLQPATETAQRNTKKIAATAT